MGTFFTANDKFPKILCQIGKKYPHPWGPHPWGPHPSGFHPSGFHPRGSTLRGSTLGFFFFFGGVVRRKAVRAVRWGLRRVGGTGGGLRKGTCSTKPPFDLRPAPPRPRHWSHPPPFDSWSPPPLSKAQPLEPWSLPSPSKPPPPSPFNEAPPSRKVMDPTCEIRRSNSMNFSDMGWLKIFAMWLRNSSIKMVPQEKLRVKSTNRIDFRQAY